ncbi:DgyrCDS7044 [Dimorphilus gyrociliatus]|uniref:RNA helicase n=1 Tax=Dimorphilus gyrociliatus TaxID=2664684 RepID=A0A7I8VQI3_9ANNE|nr:DgyrCDS7044 [Dimorphilus gyrociliatus]
MPKRHFAKGRVKKEVIIDKTEQKKIKLDPELLDDQDSEENPLVLPSQKRKTTVVETEKVPKKRLSKKQERKLKSVLQRREKKSKRKQLIEDLAKVQLPSDKLDLMTSTTDSFNQTIKKENKKIEKLKKPKKVKEIIEESESEEDKVEEFTLMQPEENEKAKDDDDKEETNESENEEEIKQDESEELKKEEKPVETSEKLTAENTKAVFVPCQRNEEIQEARLKLPILGEEQVVMETIREKDVVVLSGATGSGKSTQLPQFLYEAGYTQNGKKIVVTEPRRVAAINVSRRVGEEMNLPSSKVSYQIRYEGNVTDETEIKFVTDGVLLKEMQNDLTLSRYSVVIIDEAHERSVNTDVLIGLLSRIVLLRRKKGNVLKLIIMSATLRTEDFTANTRLFKIEPPLISVESRQYNVKVTFARKTPEDYLKGALKEVCKIHKQQPPGGILVFLTGQREVNWLCHKLKTSSNTMLPLEDKETHPKRSRKRNNKKKMPTIKLESYSALPEDEEESDLEVDEIEMLESDDGDEEIDNDGLDPMHVLPFYSLLPPERQQQVFNSVPEGKRLCVVATNVAETSITIPNIKYVVDSGKVKRKIYDKSGGSSKFEIVWTSKASADQRSGRAGRMSDGKCFRLFSSAVFEHDMPEFDEPDIIVKPAEDLYLQMKSMGIDNVMNFPFPTPPSALTLQVAERHLLALNALKRKGKTTKLTELGKTMATLPVSPKYAKMIAMAYDTDVLHYVIILVACLSVNQLFSDYLLCRKELTNVWTEGGYKLLGDYMCILTAIGATEELNSENEFCMRLGLRWKAVLEVRKLRNLIVNTINSVSGSEFSISKDLEPPSLAQATKLRKIMLGGFVDQIAKLEYKIDEETKKKIRFYQPLLINEPSQINSNSIMNIKKEDHEFIIYNDMSITNDVRKLSYIAVIDKRWLPSYCPFYCKFQPKLKYEREDPHSPYFDEESGKINCFNETSFGVNEIEWKLPIHEKEFTEFTAFFYKLYAKFLLDGLILKDLAQFSKDLLHSANMIIMSLSIPPYSKPLVQKLMNEKITDRQKLLDCFDNNEQFLLEEYLKWLPENMHYTVKKIWPPRK